ncbi:succinate dehydrogenase [Tenacibaculum finnmarkense]|nr:succinate dehydrogenase [Tenacibaculum finnmarkense genomovar ulcerans]MCG8749533.1 succinate dehydrogenase [Tenacibaculum finnmarkense]MCG8754549.1 succinate dehydrogenase [Tenacibaculum finnmarkense]MCG8761183.1 succinate dehydrogenase [Tenacibaculum finnmarkense]MCG8783246.1 succinate dehydrogenase [Tenacibaculum finnmarkense]
MEVQVEDCAQDAWDFGTREGGGNERDEYLWTNIYYTLIC